MKAISKIENGEPLKRSCSDCKLKRQCPYVDAFCKLMFEINDDFAFSVTPQHVLAEECKYFIEREPMKSMYDLVPISKIRCTSCKHFKKLENPPYDSAIPIIAICEVHEDYLRAHEWIEFAKECKHYEPR